MTDGTFTLVDARGRKYLTKLERERFLAAVRSHPKPAVQTLARTLAMTEVLRDEVAAWQAARDRIQSKVNWQFTTDDARVKLKRLYPTFDE